MYIFPDSWATDSYYFMPDKDGIDPVEAPKTCPVVYRFTGYGHPEYADQIVALCQVPGYAANEITFGDGRFCTVSDANLKLFVTAETLHTFPDTGCKRSWCDVCSVIGHYNIETGKYE